MEERVRTLEDFQARWKFYFWASCIIAGLTTTFLGINIHQLREQIDALNTSLRAKRESVENLDLRLQEIRSTAERAFARAGDLEFAVGETKKSALKADEASQLAEAAGKKATTSAEGSLAAAQKAEAVAKTVAENLRRVELIVVELQRRTTTTSIPPTQVNVPKRLKVVINGNYLNIRFEEGDTPYEEVQINQSSYDGVVYVPKGYLAVVSGQSSSSDFIIAKELKGRVVSNLSGSYNNWK